MNVHSARALVALTLLLSVSHTALAQDSTATTRHLLSLDVARVQPFRRAYDIVVRTTDSAVVIGERDLTLTSSEYSGSAGWLLVETRTGSVPATESLYVSSDLRPLHLSASLGLARLGLEFVGDSIYGVATTPAGRQNVIALGRPDLVVTQPMVEALLPLLPLTPAWSDSVAVLGIDAVSHSVWPGELAVVGEEDLVDTLTARPTWVLTLRAGDRQVLYWMAKDTGEVLRVRQPLPREAGPGRELEYRLRAAPATEGQEPRH
jgi:hypothetical protein